MGSHVSENRAIHTPEEQNTRSRINRLAARVGVLEKRGNACDEELLEEAH
jgi:hypothetical protein